MIRNRLSALLGERRMKITTLSKQTGIPRTTLTELYYDKSDGRQTHMTDQEKRTQELYEAQRTLHYYCRAIRDTTGCQTCIFGDPRNPTACRCDGRPYQYRVEKEGGKQCI